jgi:hypothetical protein
MVKEDKDVGQITLVELTIALVMAIYMPITLTLTTPVLRCHSWHGSRGFKSWSEQMDEMKFKMCTRART